MAEAGSLRRTNSPSADGTDGLAQPNGLASAELGFDRDAIMDLEVGVGAIVASPDRAPDHDIKGDSRE